MTPDMFQATRNNLDEICLGIMEGKRPVYTGGNSDVLHNFKDVGERLDIPARKALGTYWLKHADAITTYLKGGYVDPESIVTRIADCRNYLDILYAMYCEEECVAP